MIRAAGPHCVGLPLKGTKRLGPRRRNGLQAALGALSAGRPRASPPRPRGAAFQWIPMKRIRPKNSPRARMAAPMTDAQSSWAVHGRLRYANPPYALRAAPWLAWSHDQAVTPSP